MVVDLGKKTISGRTPPKKGVKMANYSTIERKDLETLLCAYDVGEILDFHELKGGLANSSFKINSAHGSYILTICDEKNVNEVQSMVNLLNLLNEKKFPTTRIVKTRNRDNTVAYKGKPVLLKKYIDGLVEANLTTGMLLQIGQAVFTLHEIPVPKNLRQKFAYGLESFEDVIDSGMDHPFPQWLKEKKADLQYHIIQTLPRGLVHGDIFCDNMLYVNDRLEAIIDFEEACHYYKIFDLGMCALGCCVENGHVLPDKVRALIQGYERGRKLETEERKQLRLFIEYAAVATAYWRFRQYNIVYPGKEMANHYLEIKQIADHIHVFPEDEFTTQVFDNL